MAVYLWRPRVLLVCCSCIQVWLDLGAQWPETGKQLLSLSVSLSLAPCTVTNRVPATPGLCSRSSVPDRPHREPVSPPRHLQWGPRSPSLACLGSGVCPRMLAVAQSGQARLRVYPWGWGNVTCSRVLA